MQGMAAGTPVAPQFWMPPPNGMGSGPPMMPPPQMFGGPMRGPPPPQMFPPVGNGQIMQPPMSGPMGMMPPGMMGMMPPGMPMMGPPR